MIFQSFLSRSFLAACAFVLTAAFASASQPGSFHLAAVTGEVSVGGDRAVTMQSLPQGAVIKTGPNSSAVVVFANGATATLGANTEVEVTKFYQEAFVGTLAVDAEAEPSVSQTEIDLRSGEIVGRVRRLSSSSTFVVNTPVGAAGVRGTIFAISYSPVTGTYTLSTVTGLMNFTQGTTQNAVGAGVRLTATFQIDAIGNIINVDVVESSLPAQAVNAIMQSVRTAVVAVNEPDSPPPGDQPGAGEPTFTIDPDLIVTPSPSSGTQ